MTHKADDKHAVVEREDAALWRIAERLAVKTREEMLIELLEEEFPALEREQRLRLAIARLSADLSAERELAKLERRWQRQDLHELNGELERQRHRFHQLLASQAHSADEKSRDWRARRAERDRRRKQLYDSAFETLKVVTKAQAMEVLIRHAALPSLAHRLLAGGDPVMLRRAELDEVACTFMEDYWASLPRWRRTMRRRGDLSAIETRASVLRWP
jgi:hypothetical protein